MICPLPCIETAGPRLSKPASTAGAVTVNSSYTLLFLFDIKRLRACSQRLVNLRDLIIKLQPEEVMIVISVVIRLCLYELCTLSTFWTLEYIAIYNHDVQCDSILLVHLITTLCLQILQVNFGLNQNI